MQQRSTPEQLARELDAAGWPSVAEDAREGVHPETLLRRLRGIGEEDSDAYAIIAAHA